MPESLRQLLAEQDELSEELNAQGYAFCHTDCEAALVMLDFAATTSVPATWSRNLENARIALRTIEHIGDRLRLTPEQSKELRSLRERVAERLREVAARRIVADAGPSGGARGK